MEISVEPSKTYAVTTSGSCTVTDADGLELCTASSGSQAFFVATTPTVTISDDGAKVSRATFNYALAVAGLLGGGADKLPAGYTRAEFLESTGTQYIDTGAKLTNESEVRMEFVLVARRSANNVIYGEETSTSARVSFFVEVAPNFYPRWDFARQTKSGTSALQAQVKYKTKHNATGASLNGKQVVTYTQVDPFETVGNLSLFGLKSLYRTLARIYAFTICRAGKMQVDYVPCITPNGKPGMYNKVDGTVRENAGSGQFIAGFTLAQARRLGKLPAGTTLTVSLPVGYDSDEGVANALAQAQENGCVLTVQTYESASAAATFALRRVWVRRVQDENGSYVAADGSRWQVEWCVDVIGADPESLGYERYRSVDAATEYWELMPYVDPNAEPETEPETEPEN